MTKDERTSPRQYQGVMISSTFTDLEAHRQALIKAIKGQGLTDIGMENDSAKAGLDVIESSLQMVRDGSAYIGLIGHKYGQTPKSSKRNRGNVSITELEFNEAQKLGRPILLFIMGEEHPVTKADVETNATKTKKLNAFRERAKKMAPDSEVHRVYATFESLQDFIEQCGRAVAELRRYLDEQSPAISAFPREQVVALPVLEPRRVVPSSLPSQPYFFGREKELGIIAEAIAPVARTWGALIDGPGGIGKTALAIRAAHLAPEPHFDRKIFLSAKVRELTPHGEQQLEDFMLPNYMALLTELARELGEDNIERTDPSERTNTVRRILADVSVLIVIDNVETFPEPERVRLYQFLSRLPAACKAIVTSRRRADIDARVVRLDRLALAEALDLLTELAKSNRHLERAAESERRDLYEITNGSPQLIKWAVGQLGRSGSQCRTIPEVSEFLKNAPPANDPLEYIFGDLLDTFTESETKVLAALSYFKEPANVRIIAEVSGLARSVALTALEDLTDRALVLSDEGQQTFLLPVLAASYMRRKRPEIIAHSGNLIVERAYALALENGYENYKRFPTLEIEWPTIAAALPLLMIGENSRLQSAVRALNSFLDFSGRWDEQLTLNELAEEKALAAADLYEAGWRAYDAGWTYHLLGKSQQVLASADRAAQYWERCQEAGPFEKATAARLRGIGDELEENYSAAKAAFNDALKTNRSESLISISVASNLSSLGDIEFAQGNNDTAERYYREALQTFRQLKDEEGIAIITGSLAAIALDRKRWKSAEKLAFEALELSEKVGRQELVGTVCMRLAEALVAQGQPNEAIRHAERAVAVFTYLRQPNLLAEAQAVLEKCRSDDAPS